MLTEQDVTYSGIMKSMLENIDRDAWALRDSVNLRINRIVELAEQTGSQPDAHLSRIISLVKVSLDGLQEALDKVEAMKPKDASNG